MANRENTFIEITPDVLLKAYACGSLLLIWHLRRRSQLAMPALVTTAAAYTVCSAAPWSAALAAL